MIAGLHPARGTIAAVSDQAPAPPADRSYLRLLMVLLGTATFFEGYDTGIAAVVIPDLARDFLVSELAVAITIATEEFPADRRGRIIGSLSLLGAFGLIAVVVAYRFVAHTSLGWRGLYLLGAIPLVAVAPLRTRLRESRRWLEAKARGERLRRTPVRLVLAGAYRQRLLLLNGMLFCFNFAVLSGAAYWTLFTRNERGLPANTANGFLAAAVVVGLPGYVLAGWLQDRWGRRRTGTLFMLTGTGFGIAAFQVHGHVPMLAALAGAVFFGLGGTPVINAMSSEF